MANSSDIFENSMELEPESSSLNSDERNSSSGGSETLSEMISALESQECPDEIFMNDESQNEDDDTDSELSGSEMLEMEDVLDEEMDNNNDIGVSVPIVATPHQWIWDTTIPTQNFNQFEDSNEGWPFAPQAKKPSLQYFRDCFSQDAVDLCILETNRYAHQVIAKSTNLSRRMQHIKNVSEMELWKMIAIRIIMGMNKLSYLTDYWSKNPIFGSKIIPKIMSSDRYFEIMRYLHFNNNEDKEQSTDRLIKLRKIWSLCTNNYPSLLKPGKNLCIDETLVLFKGRLFFKQYIPNKRSRFGIKTFSIVDIETGFVLNTIIYTGKGHIFKYSVKDFGFGGAIIMELMEPYLGKNHTLFADNYFSSPNLTTTLLSENTYYCGTARLNRRNMPIVNAKQMKKGDIKVFHSNGIMVESWKDKRVVTMISTGQRHEMIETNPTNSASSVLKPKTILDYNQNARGVDKTDMMTHFYTLLRKTHKWHKKMFFQLLDINLYNAYCMKKAVDTGLKFKQFRVEVVTDILNFVGSSLQEMCVEELQHGVTPLRLSPGKHFLNFNPSAGSKKHRGRPCVVCSERKDQKRPRESVYHCKLCLVSLCAIPCFEHYHTKRNILD